MNKLFVSYFVMTFCLLFDFVWSSESSTQIVIEKPIWATDFGKDKYGVWCDLKINVTQRFRWIQPGDFLMGNKDNIDGVGEKPVRNVKIESGFWLGETETTQEFWKAVTGDNPSQNKNNNHPVENISWLDCEAFFEKMNKMVNGLKSRFPSSTEWEYACRAGTNTDFSTGKTISVDQANFFGMERGIHFPKRNEYRNHTVAVKSFDCNQWGLYDMHGNVSEPCSDKGDSIILNNTPVVSRCFRGGWFSSNPLFIRSSAISWQRQDLKSASFGLRICISN